MELELAGRDVTRDDGRPQPRELEGEPPRPGAGVGHAIAWSNVLAEEAQMDFEVDAVHRRGVEAFPLASPVLVEEAAICSGS
jgi:hypothetical protein